MRAIFLFGLLFFCFIGGSSQLLKNKLEAAMRELRADPQLGHAIIGVCVVDNKTGKLVFEQNAQVGLTPASTQKIITSIAAFELLGKNYRYETSLGYSGKLENGIIEGDVYIIGSGDPSLGSWRFDSSSEEKILNKWVDIFKKKRVTTIRGEVRSLIYKDQWSTQTLPGGWIWEDIGNYYGAGTGALNWRENQYDLLLKPGKKNGDKVQIIGTRPTLFDCELISELLSASANSGDNAYIYLPPLSQIGFVRGTIPSGKDTFVISGAFPNPAQQLTNTLKSRLNDANITVLGVKRKQDADSAYFKPGILSLYHSPLFDSLNYWFMKKSINLYGEAFMKSIARQNQKMGSTENGIEVVQNSFVSKGIDKAAINIVDGSGLSPQNRVTPEVLVRLLRYAKSRTWFSSFYSALPEYHGMKMKSGSMAGVRAFAGYHKATDGKEYTFSFIINNFNGSGSDVVNKMYKFLDILK